MGKGFKAARLAERAVTDLTSVREGETVLVVADEAAMEEYPEVPEAITGLARQAGAEATLVVMADSREYVGKSLPETVEAAMELADVVIGCTRTTTASAYYHETPTRLVNEGRIRVLALVNRSWEGLTGPHVLEVDYDELAERGDRIVELLEDGSRLYVSSELGSDLTAGIEGAIAKRSPFAHEAGTIAVPGMGEADVGPIVGTTEGRAVFDGVVWLEGNPQPSPPLEMEIRNGEVVSVKGDERIVDEIESLFDEKENARNVAEFGIGINPYADLAEINVRKKRLGTIHMGVGKGLNYGQDVDSPVHIDFVMECPTLRIDETTVLDDGEYVLEDDGTR